MMLAQKQARLIYGPEQKVTHISTSSNRLIFDKDPKMHIGEMTPFFNSVVGNWISLIEEKLMCYLSPFTTVTSNVRDFNVRLGTPKVLEENIEKTLPDRGIGKDFLNRILVALEVRPSIDKWDLMIKSFCTGKEVVN